MSQLGMGVLLHVLSGGSKHSPEEYIGKKIAGASMNDDKLQLVFDDGKKIQIWDDGQSCCEYRHMSTDDDIQSLIGHILTRIDVKPGSDGGEEWEYDVHETCFVEIGTDAGFITIVNHNEHNGYYGGFGLTITEAP